MYIVICLVVADETKEKSYERAEDRQIGASGSGEQGRSTGGGRSLTGTIWREDAAEGDGRRSERAGGMTASAGAVCA